MEQINKKIINKLFDKNIRSRLLADTPDLSALEEIGYSIGAGVEVKIVVSTKDLTYVTMPSDSIDLTNVSAAMAVGIGTAASIGTLTSSISSASTASSAIVI